MLVSKTLYKRLWSALGVGPVALHATIARICVLYEDLRIELQGYEKQLPDLEAIGENYRRNYFVRRSIGTILEFSGALKMLDENTDWQSVKEKFDTPSAELRTGAMKFFKEHHTYIKQIRDDFGGHFGYAAAKWAVENLSKDAPGSIEIYRKPLEHKAGPKMHFASEFVSTAMCRHKGKRHVSNHRRCLPAFDELRAHHRRCISLFLRCSRKTSAVSMPSSRSRALFRSFTSSRSRPRMRPCCTRSTLRSFIYAIARIPVESI